MNFRKETLDREMMERPAEVQTYVYNSHLLA